MTKRTGPTNPILRKEIRKLYNSYKIHGAPIWKYVAEKLSVSKRQRVAVNLLKLNRLTSANDSVVVPGRVLGFGYIEHPITIAAFYFSKSARDKIEKVGGKCITYEEMIKINPKGSNIKLVI
ncbi:MAG TPA: 50S ribosomal protein L18e [Geobacterales bacterium]|nr:50S ribosomal protein L18e [Geobacterales bacterium]